MMIFFLLCLTLAYLIVKPFVISHVIPQWRKEHHGYGPNDTGPK